MGFFERNRKALADRGVDRERLPPGQYFTERFPVLHAGDVPSYPDLSTWTLRIFGLVAGSPVTLSWAELTALPTESVTRDIHCVTKWSKFDTAWEGVPARTLLELAGGPVPEAQYVMAHAEFGYTANLPLAAVLDDAYVAFRYGGEPLEPEHGYPARLLVPSLYFWKSAKWLRGLELMGTDVPGFWERNGYHNDADPWREQRYWGD